MQFNLRNLLFAIVIIGMVVSTTLVGLPLNHNNIENMFVQQECDDFIHRTKIYTELQKYRKEYLTKTKAML